MQQQLIATMAEAQSNNSSSRSSPPPPVAASTRTTKVKAGPDPLLMSRKEVDVLYDIFEAVRTALDRLGVEYVVTGGSLLGAVRQHSILFCDDDIDIAVIDRTAHDETSVSIYESVVLPNLQSALDDVVAAAAAAETTTATTTATTSTSTSTENNDKPKYVYQIRPWEGGDRIRSKRFNNVFLDLFVLRMYPTKESFLSVIGRKRNGQDQPGSYVHGILDKIQTCINNSGDDGATAVSSSESFPFWHFSTRKAIEMWPKEVYRAARIIPSDSHLETESLSLSSSSSSLSSSLSNCSNVDELFPIQQNLKFGPLTGVCGPHVPVTLLKRAFGEDCFEVYYKCVSHRQGPSQQQQHHHHQKKSTNGEGDGDGEGDDQHLPPLVAPGGTWESSPKVPLEKEHYLPMQPLARQRRRPTLHCRETLFAYLMEETIREARVQTELEAGRRKSKTTDLNATNNGADNATCRPRRTVYMDGVFDLFHIGHLKAIRQCAALGDRVVLGVTGDADAEGYKRRPIVPEHERTALVGSMKEVDNVICPCPLIVTEEFMDEHGIDLVVHGFANDADANNQEEFFAIPIRLGKFQRIGYAKDTSTTDRLKTIRDDKLKKAQEQERRDTEKKKQEGADNVTKSVQRKQLAKPQWFGATLAVASNHSPTIPTDPFPLDLRVAIESHIDKARIRRTEALSAIRTATGASVYDAILHRFEAQQERLSIAHLNVSEPNVEQDRHRHLTTSLLTSTGFPPTTDLSMLHKETPIDGKIAKDRLLHTLTQNYDDFQNSYDAFVRSVGVPRLVAALEDGSGSEGGSCAEVFYQAFPCLRIVQPGEFSIGPHCDVAYGHHPCSVNGYVSLTKPHDGCDSGTGGAPASSLFLESRPGAEDWHSLFGRNNSNNCHTKFFAGALNLHWTTENLTERTRVTLDFRMIEGRVFKTIRDGGHLEGGQKDVFRDTHGYYHRCYKNSETGEWIRDTCYPDSSGGNGLERPDFRMGFPWTVKNWDKFWKKQAKTESQ